MNADALAATPGLIEQTKAALLPAGAGAVAPFIAKLAILCKHGQGESIERAAQASVLIEYVATQPLDSVVWAVDQWIRTQIFFPAISELLALCEERTTQIRCIKVRLESLLLSNEAAASRRAEDERIAADKLDTTAKAKEVLGRLDGGTQ